MEERISGWLAKIPGYTGYRSKENRRDEDKRIRVAIADSLNAVVDQLTRTSADLAAKRDLARISAVESALADTRHFADRIRNASYGYGGIFTEHSIDEIALDQLRQFDVALQREAQGLARAASTVGTDEGLAAYREELTRLTTLFDGRSAVVDTGRPSADQQTLALLERSGTTHPSPLLDVAVGDALSVLGDNFTADATIELKYRDATIKLIRIASNPPNAERWLLGTSDTESMPSADLTEVDTSSAVVPLDPAGSHPATMSVSGPQGTAGDVPVSYAYQSGENSGISLAIDVGGEVRSFRGKVLQDIDVEVYGPATTS